MNKQFETMYFANSILKNEALKGNSIKKDAFAEQRSELSYIKNNEVLALQTMLEMRDDFLSVVSHELRTPITVVNSAVQALEYICGDELSEKAKSFISKIKQNSLRQLRLVNSLLDITRSTSGNMKINKKNQDIVTLTKEITESVNLYAQQKDIKLNFESAFKHKELALDVEKFERIILNLLSNAIKFTPGGKSVSVRLSTLNSKVCVEVRDEGIGIPPDKLNLIFERFGQVDSSLSRQAEGTGIGLYLVKLLVEELGGNISVHSKQGSGSIFTILLPIETAGEEHIEPLLEQLTDNRLAQSTAIEFAGFHHGI